MMKVLSEILEHELQDLYSAEVQLTQAIPKLAKHSDNKKLKEGFEHHLGQTKQHIARLEEAAKALGVSPKGKTCKGMKGLIEEGAELLKEDKSPSIDAALIGAAQRVEHYEIAGYGTAIAHAKLLGEEEVVDLLTRTLEEEEETDKKLTHLAESEINEQALLAV